MLGTHHYVQLSEFDLSTTGLSPDSLKSVKVVIPVGAAVPDICRAKLKKIFPYSVWYMKIYGQSEAGVVSQGFQEFGGLCRIQPGVTMKVFKGTCSIHLF